MAQSTAWSKAVLVQTQEEERYRLARALQNGPAQLLANAVFEVESSLLLLNTDPVAAHDGLTSLLEELRQGLGNVRKMIMELQPPLLSELGLVASLRKYSDTFSEQTGISTSLSGWESLRERLPATMETAIFRIVQEAMENVRAHSHATKVRITLERGGDHLIVTVADNGQGFRVEEGLAPSARKLGLAAMRDRADLLDGQLKLFSRQDHGVDVVLTVPVHGHVTEQEQNQPGKDHP